MRESIIIYVIQLVLLANVTQGQNSCTVPAKTSGNENININHHINTTLCQQIIFLDTEYTMDAIIAVANKSPFAMIGKEGKTIIHCLPGAGFNFSNITGLNISNIQFKNCGLLSSPSEKIHFSVAVLIADSCDIHILNTEFSESNGTGLVLINVKKNVTICNTGFISNTNTAGYWSGGGGLYIGIINQEEAEYFINNCNFSHNRAKINNESLNCDDGIYSGIGWGGAMSIRLIDNSISVKISICDSILKNNSAGWGGAVELVICRSQDVSVLVYNTNITCNNATKYGGGGIDIEFTGNGTQENTITVEKTTFKQNQAMFGGGAAISTHFAFNQFNNSVTFHNCNWSTNHANYGSGVDIYPAGIIDAWNEVPNINFENCSFESNYNDKISVRKSIFRLGEGVVMITGLSVIFKGHIDFFNNDGSCIYAISSQVMFESGVNALFQNNTAENGAGIALIGYSVIVVNNHSNLSFFHNRVTGRGGAIYYYSIDKHTYVLHDRCFIQSFDYKPTSISFNFTCNMARHIPNYNDNKYMKNSIFSTADLSKCCESKTNCTFRGIGKFSFDNENNVCMSSGEVCEGQFYISDEKNFTFMEEGNGIKFIPGNKSELPLSTPGITSELSLSKISSFDVTIENNSNIMIHTSQYKIIDEKLKIYSDERKGRANITLTETSNRRYSLSLIAEIQNCPPFYKLSDKKCVCYGSEDIFYVSMFICNGATLNSMLHVGYWVGNRSNGDLIYSNCPNGYCNQGNETGSNITRQYLQLPNDISELDEFVCDSGRRGLLCGECKPNRTVYFYSRKFTCGTTEKCHLGTLLYLLTEILPVTIVFVLVTVFNISFTSGGLSGFILFAQLIDTIIDVGKHYQTNDFLEPIYRLFNLDFGGNLIEYCLWEKANTMDILMLKYLTILYVLILVIATVLLIKTLSMCRCVRLRKLRYSVIQGFSTFLILSYSQCMELSFSILNPSFIYKERKWNDTVVFLQGNLTYFSREHLPYAVPALIIFTFFIVPLPSLLIFHPLCNKLILLLKFDEHRGIKLLSRLIPVHKIKPLLDCFQGPFKDNFRFYAGLYFLYRVTFVVSRLAPTALLIYASMGLQIIFMLTLHTILQPYQKRIHNLIDTLLISNLAVITVLKLIAEAQAETQNSVTNFIVVEVMLIYIPLIVLGLFAGYKIFKELRGKFRKRKPAKQETEDIDTIFLEDDVREESMQEEFVLLQDK